MPTLAQELVRIDANLQWRNTIGAGGNYVAVCDPLKLTLQAETWGELMEDTADVLNAIFKDLMSSHELETFLRDHGWSVVSGYLPAHEERENVRFDVPFFFAPLAAAQAHGSERHVR